eukprot:CAMPEP_0204108910 /NCGR_PEP_ID=MMETSP0361-20130328/985_1 /ASSEMBLY_ACC=CAM_ASM_000343 /TAXON_ID=268821 /ORGANISM="Scrippsiella Hangoei, Strain SHTV-5" /LENGTH=99 /DNA_ID=CAMNT_0051058595 /DNA_START=140 /DNA_END=437 /DNA_ORIENTATION=+
MCAQPQRVGSKTVQVAVQTPAKPTRCHHEWLDQRFNDEEESAKRQCAPPYHKLCLSQATTTLRMAEQEEERAKQHAIQDLAWQRQGRQPSQASVCEQDT